MFNQGENWDWEAFIDMWGTNMTWYGYMDTQLAQIHASRYSSLTWRATQSFLILHDVPQSSEKNLHELVCEITTHMQVTVTPNNDISTVYRIPQAKTNQNKTISHRIFVKFICDIQRDTYMLLW